MNVPRPTIVDLCNRFGGALKVPPTIDGARLLWALAGNESSFGLNASPRHEQAYCHGGRYYDKALTGIWGCLAHCSFGAWQVMYPNISFGGAVSPLDVMNKPEVAANAAVQFINRRILMAEKATTIEEIADAYNSGDWRDSIIPEKYIADLVKNYAIAIGEAA
jgi:hypothetical protein